MRYRPFGGAGVAVSSISMSLSDPKGRLRAKDWSRLILNAVEHGVNAFEIDEITAPILEGLAGGLGGVERRLLFVSWRSRTSCLQALPFELSQGLERILSATGLTYLDLVNLDEPGGEPSGPEISAAIAPLEALRDSRRVKLFGVRGESDSVDTCIDTGVFDAVATSFSLGSGWKERHRIKRASQKDLAVIGLDYHPESLKEAAKGPKAQRSPIWRRSSDPLSGSGTYMFLDRTRGWSAEDICLTYALTEPALSTIQIHATDEKRLAGLVEAPERDLPTGVAAQIEMARFSEPPGGVERRRA